MARTLKPISATQVGENGQITIPEAYRKAYHLEKDSPLFLIQFGDVLMLVPPDKVLTGICDKIQKALKGKGITVEKAKVNLQAIRARRFKNRFGDLK